MPTEGMVHALRRTHRLLAPGGCLIDLHPTPADASVEVGGLSVGSLDAVVAQRRHAAAEAALAVIVAEGLFAISGVREFVFHTYGDSVEELRDHIHSSWRDSRVSDALVARARDAVRVNPAATLRVIEQVRVTTLSPR